jgi:hypothetical protein
MRFHGQTVLCIGIVLIVSLLSLGARKHGLFLD